MFPTPEQVFLRELDIFRKEVESACQFFYGGLAMNESAYRYANVRRMFNANALWWITVDRALQDAAFIALGRVFDQKSHHGVDRLLRSVERNVTMFSEAAFKRRKPETDLTPYELRANDVRRFRKQVATHRRIYEKVYGKVRDRVIAHPDLADDDNDTHELFSRTSKAELERLLGFLGALHDALSHLYMNGRKPVIRRYRRCVRKDGRLTIPRFKGSEFPRRFVFQAVATLREASGDRKTASRGSQKSSARRKAAGK